MTDIAPLFSHVRTWVFDLDHTLYPPSDRLFAQIEVKMTAFVARELGLSPEAAIALCLEYWRTHGSTLAGLMTVHGWHPDAFLRDVHDIDVAHMRPDPDLARRIAALPGRRIVFTNGSRAYAERVLAARGLDGRFDAVYGVEEAGFRPKPERAAYDAIIARDGLDPRCAAMFEDDARNLEVPHALGMRTVHIAPLREIAAHVHHHHTDLSEFLSQLTA